MILWSKKNPSIISRFNQVCCEHIIIVITKLTTNNTYYTYTHIYNILYIYKSIQMNVNEYFQRRKFKICNNINIQE